MRDLHLRVLGGFEIVAQRVVTLPTRKAEALLTFLALSAGQKHRRDAIASLLWSDQSRDQAHHSLRQTIYLIQKRLGDLGLRPLMADRHMVALEQSAIRVDAIRMQHLAATGTPKALAEAASLYRGELLSGIEIADEVFEEWLREQRARHRELASDVLMRLVRSQRKSGDLQEALQTGLRLVAMDPIREDAQRLLIELYFDLGRPDSAARQYREYRLILRRELGIGPSLATRELFQKISVVEDTAASPGHAAKRSPPSSTTPVLVVAFDTRVPDTELRRAANRFVGNLVISLSRARLLTTVVVDRNEDADLEEVSARYALIGSVAGRSNAARLRLRLQDALGGEVIWTAHHTLNVETSGEAAVEAAAGAIVSACHAREKTLAKYETRLAKTAAAYWHGLGQRAAERFAHKEAFAHFSQSLQLLEGLPESPERVRQEISTQLGKGTSLMAIKGPSPEVSGAFSRAQQLSEEVGDVRQRYAAVWGLWFYDVMRMKYDEARALSYDLIDLADQAEDRGLLLQGHHSAWAVLLYRGEFDKCREHAERGLALYDPKEHRAHALTYGGHDPGVCCRYQGSLSLWALGYPEQSSAMVQDAISLARELSQPFSEAIALSTSCYVHQIRGEAKQAEKQAEATVAFSLAQGFPSYVTTGNLLRGWAVAALGELEAGVPVLRESLAGLHAAGTDVRRTYYLALLAETLGKAGQIEEGLETLDEALEFAFSCGERWWEAELHRLRGELLLARSQDNLTDAEVCIQQALAVAREQHARSFELRSATTLARIWGEQRRRSEAHDLLAPVYNWFTEGFDTPDLKEAKALLDELS